MPPMLAHTPLTCVSVGPPGIEPGTRGLKGDCEIPHGATTSTGAAADSTLVAPVNSDMQSFAPRLMHG